MLTLTRRNAITIIASVLAIAFGFEQARLIFTFLGRYTNEDHAILWLAASDWARLRPHEPTFYGQPYGVNFEAIPMALFRALDCSYGMAFPVALIAMASLAWLLLAWAALRRGAFLLVVAAVAMPVLLNLEHWIIVGVIGTGVGRLLAAVGVVLALREKHTPWHAFAVVCVTSLAVMLDTAAATLALPALVWAGWGFPLRRRLLPMWLGAALGVVPAIAWRLYNDWFNRAYPDHVLHPPPTFDPTWRILMENMEKPDRLFAQQAFELAPKGWVVLALLALCWLITLGARAYRELIAATCACALVLGLASLPKAMDSYNCIWLPSARMSLTTPMALWFCGLMAYFALRERILWRDRSLVQTVVAVVLVLCCWTVGVRARDWDIRLAPILRAGLGEGRLPLRRVDDVERVCREANDAASEAQTNIVVFPNDRSAAYGCPAIYRKMLTAHPGYERRFWVLRRLAALQATRMLVWGLAGDTCKQKRVRRAFEHCTPVANGQAMRFDFQTKPALEAMLPLGLNPRPFGPGCNPHDRDATCKWWAEHYR